MRSKFLLLTGVVLAGTVAVIAVSNNGLAGRIYGWMLRDTLEQRQHQAVLGVFDPAGALGAADLVAMRHVGVVLRDAHSWGIARDPLAGFAADQPLLVTVEAWGSRFGVDLGGGLQAVARGAWDGKIQALCAQVLSRGPQTFVRFNPDMEVPAGRYPWQNMPLQYIDAFRRFSRRVKTCAPAAKIVWAPASYPGALEFWPGAEYVDAVSVTLKGDSEWTATAYPHEDSVYEGLRRKLHRLRFIDKPVLVLGSQRVAPSDFEASFLTKIAREQAREPTLYGAALRRPPAPLDTTAEYPRLQLGLYDPNLLLTDEPALSVEHLFADFDTLADDRFERALADALGRGHDVVVTVEPMYRDESRKDRKVLEHILEGRHDAVFRPLLERLANCGSRVYLRFAHEMEIPITRYPWQSQDPLTYIKAFRYFMELQPKSARNIVRVWGPAGDRGSLEWWPGDDAVDLISIAVYGLPDSNITDPDKQESFKTIFNRKYYRLRFVSKPIFITEFGVKGPEEYQDRWLADAAQTIVQNPQVIGINYFNMVDTPKAWGEATKPPDWSISRASFRGFADRLVRGAPPQS